MHDLLCGKLLGDGCLTKQLGRKPRFQFTHCKQDKGWSEHCYESLSSFLPLNPPKYRKLIDSRTTAGYTESYIVQSRTSEEFCRLYEIWYPLSQKTLPIPYIQKHFTDRSLAWWYQDDGHLKQQRGIPRKIILSTDSFSKKENLFLIDFLKKKYGLAFSLDNQNRLLLYDQFQIIYFLKLVDPYLHESMSRKKSPPGTQRKIAARTSIYLPNNIVLIKPTSEINSQYEKLPLLIKIISDHHGFFKWYSFISKQTRITNGYQIRIEADHRKVLERLRVESGLSVSQLTMCCFNL
ncbi:hypothetical protein [Planococcus lenghuensis]|uniref:Homing endonuclease LAGLIDADG domain-containing protein n=1 Tax=Planococcus lenghuensis TaxID=2213202 RepID=A0A1Q2L148_9BACL|nr:hypothetical protein [Planococcus lenghuensis]AQQ54151.1 hypothetical protein B0X71_14240 [Planococcus lenghuensis]